MVADFALMSGASAVDPLRAANQMSGQSIYEMCFLSVACGPVRSSCGSWFDTVPFSVAPSDLEWLFIMAGGNPFVLQMPDCLCFLRRCAGRVIPFGGISGGVVLLARAGLLQMRRIAVHCERHPLPARNGLGPANRAATVCAGSGPRHLRG